MLHCIMDKMANYNKESYRDCYLKKLISKLVRQDSDIEKLKGKLTHFDSKFSSVEKCITRL